MVEKDMGYSIEQISSFLEKMNGAKKIDVNLWRFKAATIKLFKLEKNIKSYFNTERCIMRLDGDERDIEEFYYSFLINHMTMGG